MADILNRLLEDLYEGQSYCPVCRREYGHEDYCYLKGYWPPLDGVEVDD